MIIRNNNNKDKIDELNKKNINLEQINNNLNNKIKDIHKNIELEKERLNNREIIILNKEKEINDKIGELKNRENQILNEKKKIEIEIIQIKKYIEENKYIKQQNNELTIKNMNLEKEIKEKQEILFDIQQNQQLKLDMLKKNEGNKIIEIKNPILIGLNNIGATCFMNATLQCLSQTRDLTNYFLNEKNKNRIINNNIAVKNRNDLQLSPIYNELIQRLWQINGPKSFSPNGFMNIIEKMNPLFKQGQAGDSKDFIIYILEQLHKELKRSINQNNININEPLNQYDKNNAFNHFFYDFQQECSIISDIYFGFTETTNECLYCKKIYNSKGLNSPICYNYGIFNCLIFPLEEVKNMKNNYLQNNNIFINQNNSVTIYECFHYNQKSDLFTGQNQNYCNICKQLADSIYTSKIFSTPKNLILILNRGKGNIYNVKLEFSEIIDITQFVLKKDMPKLIYNLYGIITHIGQSGPNAHFVASCKSSVDNKWYRFNDAMVYPISDFQKEVIELGTPYILFYQKHL